MTEFDLPRDLSTLFIVVSTGSTTAFLQKLIFRGGVFSIVEF